jgi:hypothetical protein
VCVCGGGGWTLMKNISVTEYLNYEGGKFGKSRGTGGWVLLMQMGGGGGQHEGGGGRAWARQRWRV